MFSFSKESDLQPFGILNVMFGLRTADWAKQATAVANFKNSHYWDSYHNSPLDLTSRNQLIKYRFTKL